MKKKRIDKLLYEKALVSSREKARALVMAGCVFIKDIRVEKAGQLVPYDAPVVLKKSAIPYVSRGGIKLEKAIKEFGILVAGKTVLDVGASTGGFTDCLLQYGAKRVYAVDVGYGQLDTKIANHPKVVCKDRINIRYASLDEFPDPFDLVTIDVSFISLRLVLPVIKKLLAHPGGIIALVKPQFEVSKGQVGKGGIVREPEKHVRVLREIIDFSQNQDLFFADLTTSPIIDKRKNREFLLYLIYPGKPAAQDLIDRKIKQQLLFLQQ